MLSSKNCQNKDVRWKCSWKTELQWKKSELPLWVEFIIYDNKIYTYITMRPIKKNIRFYPHNTCHMFCSLLLRYWESHPSGAHLVDTRFSHRFLCWSHRLLEDCRKQMSFISRAPYQIQISLFRFSRRECQQERESSLCVFLWFSHL